MQKVTIRTKFIAKREDLYGDLVFQNLDEPENSGGRYIVVTKLPNGQGCWPAINDEGFLTYEIAKAGDEYYKPDLDRGEKYKNDGQYFLSFIKINNTQPERQEYKF